ncbi:hypothetical protein MSAN_01983800 [Mycena sanguinolenta]|uniref:Uncharacterized protein n=1 Tax=Mycena sanguinolenta TaxID=230812 RepID=A0A8H7CPL3_9AGAR|nr:hypothetical protein MSAN_01983800 [Mycena sanguinolenta]
MFSTKPLLSVVAAALLAGTVNAYTGTAILGFYNTTSCGCPAFNGPYAVAIPRELVGTQSCCDVGITLSYGGETTDAVFSGYYEAGAGTENVALSPEAFAALAGFPDEVSLSPVTWSFD